MKAHLKLLNKNVFEATILPEVICELVTSYLDKSIKPIVKIQSNSKKTKSTTVVFGTRNSRNENL